MNITIENIFEYSQTFTNRSFMKIYQYNKLNTDNQLKICLL